MQRVQVVLLVEGRDDERFLRRYLARLPMVRSLRALLPPPGTQSGEQHVRERFAAEVASFRRNRGRVAEALIVMTDADTQPVAARRRTLEQALQQGAQAPRRDDERIVLLVPKRNVETWVAHLNGAAVDEATDYKPRPADEFRHAAERLRTHCRAADSNCCPPSLVDGCKELVRLE